VMGHRMSDIFISYSSENRDFALQIGERLEQFFNVWIDREGIEGGMQWEKVITEAVKACTVFIVIVTPESNQSEWVARETILAERLGKYRIPLFLDGELPFRLLNLHYIDFQGDFEGGFRDLLETLNQHLQPQDKTRVAVNQLLGEAVRCQLDDDITTARNFVCQALAMQPDLSDTVESFWDSLNLSPTTHDATLLQSQLDAGTQLIEEVVKPVDEKLYDNEKQAYEWHLRLNTTDNILDQIDYVRYELHPTFVNPERIIRDRKSAFQLRLVGWGVFEIPVTIHFKDGSSVQTNHHLQFP
jgi:TIR domain/prokaryotic YEATS domain